MSRPVPETFNIHVDGVPVTARPGDTVMVVLLRAGITPVGRASGRGLFCGMGSCFECHAVIDGVPFTRMCMTTAKPEMQVRTGAVAGARS